ncbi:hypothetical protein HanIR_Chr17g0852941 [Helianthus annuus]|nr:hypothetical protein HanIR_Chr17g0852941 [Helianthus annuus]
MKKKLSKILSKILSRILPICFGQSIIGWNHISGIRAARDLPGPMVAQTLSEIEFYQWMNESLAKLESQMQTLLNEFRSIRTAWEAPQTHIQSPTAYVSKPLPASTAAKSTHSVQPSATTAVKPSPKNVSALKRVPATTPPTTTTPSPAFATVPILNHNGLLCGIHLYHQLSYSRPKAQKPEAKKIPSLLGSQGYRHHVQTYAGKLGKSHEQVVHVVEVGFGATSMKKAFTRISDVWNNFTQKQIRNYNDSGKYKIPSQDVRSSTAWKGLIAGTEPKASPVVDWRPPWRTTKIHSDNPGITEWRPPWFVMKNHPDFILEDKDILTGKD